MNKFHECRYILHLKDYDAGVFFYREVLGLQPNFNWAIVPDNKGYRFFMGTGRLEITQYPFPHPQGRGELTAECRNLALCRERILEEMPDADIVDENAGCLLLRDVNGNLVRLVQGSGEMAATGPVEKTNMFTGGFTCVLYEDDLTEAASFYRDYIGLEELPCGEGRCVFRAGDALLELKERPEGAGPSMLGLEAESVNQLHERLLPDPRYNEAGVLRDTDFDKRRLFQILDPGGNVIEFYAYLKNVREEILLH